jgi:hypothetical protein
MSDFQTQVLVAYGANVSEVAELLAYDQNVFEHNRSESCQDFPLASEPHALVWQEYANKAKQSDVLTVLKPALVQLNFPIQLKISQSEGYIAATRRGAPPDGILQASGLGLNHPEKLELVLHPTLAGILPVLIAGDRPDFVSLVQALLKKNEPDPIPDSMGSVIVSGYNNWDRVHRYLDQWQIENRLGSRDEEFQRMIPHRELYQDRFMILSRGPYSAVSAQEMQMSADEWANLSLQIRLEHESTHYFTRRVLNSMRNNVMDELIADYRGLIAATGRYCAAWACRFVGVMEPGSFRPGGRLENYRGVPPLSDGAFRVLQKLVRAASAHLEQFAQARAVDRQDAQTQALELLALTYLTIEELASDQGSAILESAWNQVRRKNDD